MVRKKSLLAPDWWDFTTLDDEILNDAQRLTAEDMLSLSREGFTVKLYDTLTDLYFAEAVECIGVWRQATPDNPVGLCGLIGPTERLAVVARLANELDLNLKDAHFWGMYEWLVDDKVAPVNHPLSFEKAVRELCFDRVKPELQMPDANMHFPSEESSEYIKSWESGVRCALMQGVHDRIKHWAFNEPFKREGKYKDNPPSPDEYRQLTTRPVELHPISFMKKSYSICGEVITGVPKRAVTVGPVQTWKADKVSIWHTGIFDNPFGIRLTTLMIGKKILDSSVPISLLADHPNVQLNIYRSAIGTCDYEVENH